MQLILQLYCILFHLIDFTTAATRYSLNVTHTLNESDEAGTGSRYAANFSRSLNLTVSKADAGSHYSANISRSLNITVNQFSGDYDVLNVSRPLNITRSLNFTRALNVPDTIDGAGHHYSWNFTRSLNATKIPHVWPGYLSNSAGTLNDSEGLRETVVMDDGKTIRYRKFRLRLGLVEDQPAAISHRRLQIQDLPFDWYRYTTVDNKMHARLGVAQSGKWHGEEFFYKKPGLPGWRDFFIGVFADVIEEGNEPAWDEPTTGAVYRGSETWNPSDTTHCLQNMFMKESSSERLGYYRPPYAVRIGSVKHKETATHPDCPMKPWISYLNDSIRDRTLKWEVIRQPRPTHREFETPLPFGELIQGSFSWKKVEEGGESRFILGHWVPDDQPWDPSRAEKYYSPIFSDEDEDITHNGEEAPEGGETNYWSTGSDSKDSVNNDGNINEDWRNFDNAVFPKKNLAVWTPLSSDGNSDSKAESSKVEESTENYGTTFSEEGNLKIEDWYTESTEYDTGSDDESINRDFQITDSKHIVMDGDYGSETTNIINNIISSGDAILEDEKTLANVEDKIKYQKRREKRSFPVRPDAGKRFETQWSICKVLDTLDPFAYELFFGAVPAYHEMHSPSYVKDGVTYPLCSNTTVYLEFCADEACTTAKTYPPKPWDFRRGNPTVALRSRVTSLPSLSQEYVITSETSLPRLTVTTTETPFQQPDGITIVKPGSWRSFSQVNTLTEAAIRKPVQKVTAATPTTARIPAYELPGVAYGLVAIPTQHTTLVKSKAYIKRPVYSNAYDTEPSDDYLAPRPRHRHAGIIGLVDPFRLHAVTSTDLTIRKFPAVCTAMAIKKRGLSSQPIEENSAWNASPTVRDRIPTESGVFPIFRRKFSRPEKGYPEPHTDEDGVTGFAKWLPKFLRPKKSELHPKPKGAVAPAKWAYIKEDYPVEEIIVEEIIHEHPSPETRLEVALPSQRKETPYLSIRTMSVQRDLPPRLGSDSSTLCTERCANLGYWTHGIHQEHAVATITESVTVVVPALHTVMPELTKVVSVIATVQEQAMPTIPLEFIEAVSAPTIVTITPKFTKIEVVTTTIQEHSTSTITPRIIETVSVPMVVPILKVDHGTQFDHIVPVEDAPVVAASWVQVQPSVNIQPVATSESLSTTTIHWNVPGYSSPPSWWTSDTYWTDKSGPTPIVIKAENKWYPPTSKSSQPSARMTPESERVISGEYEGRMNVVTVHPTVYETTTVYPPTSTSSELSSSKTPESENIRDEGDSQQLDVVTVYPTVYETMTLWVRASYEATETSFASIPTASDSSAHSLEDHNEDSRASESEFSSEDDSEELWLKHESDSDFSTKVPLIGIVTSEKSSFTSPLPTSTSISYDPLRRFFNRLHLPGYNLRKDGETIRLTLSRSATPKLETRMLRYRKRDRLPTQPIFATVPPTPEEPSVTILTSNIIPTAVIRRNNKTTTITEYSTAPPPTSTTIEMVTVTADWWADKMKKVGLGNNPLAADIGVNLFPWKAWKEQMDNQEDDYVTDGEDGEEIPDTDGWYDESTLAELRDVSENEDEDKEPYNLENYDAEPLGYGPYDEAYQEYNKDAETRDVDNDYPPLILATSNNAIPDKAFHVENDSPCSLSVQDVKPKKRLQKIQRPATFEGQEYVLLDFDQAPYQHLSPGMLDLAFAPPPPPPKRNSKDTTKKDTKKKYASNKGATNKDTSKDGTVRKDTAKGQTKFRYRGLTE